MNWTEITNEEVLKEIKEVSKSKKVLIFKHSIRCSISAMALNRLQKSWIEPEMEGLKPYYLDLINYRHLSNKIAEDFGIIHQSPQAIVIENEKAIYDTSHMGINYNDLKDMAVSATN